MGHRLRKMIAYGAPREWTSLMRLVACEIAADANDKDAEPWSALPIAGHWDAKDQWRDGLAELCGASERAISAALTALARDGYDMRQPIAFDKRGRPVFAVKGRALRFRVPSLPPRPTPQRTHETAGFERPKDADPRIKARRSAYQSTQNRVSKDAADCDPSRGFSTGLDQSHARAPEAPLPAGAWTGPEMIKTIIDGLKTKTGITIGADEAVWIAETTRCNRANGKPIPNPVRWMRTVILNEPNPRVTLMRHRVY